MEFIQLRAAMLTGKCQELDIVFSIIFYSWYTLPHSQQDVLRLVQQGSSNGTAADSSPPPLGSDSSFDASDTLLRMNGPSKLLQYFDKVKELCVVEAQKNGSTLHRQRITVVNGDWINILQMIK
jgi:hypothetical protein